MGRDYLQSIKSFFQKPLPHKSIAIGELSLTGQIKPINQIDMRIKEAEKFGIQALLVSRSQKIQAKSKIISFQNVYELLSLFPQDT